MHNDIRLIYLNKKCVLGGINITLNRTLKVKNTYEELMTHMKAKGIKFNGINEEDAKNILQHTNYYYKLTSYKRNFSKNSVGKYNNLEFSYLYDLSTIDMRLRYILLHMCLDIEHTLKVKILKDITDNTQLDGYDIVDRFFKHENLTADDCMPGSAAKTHYNEKLYKRYLKDPPIWVLLETMQFGIFVRFIEFYTYKITKNDDYYLNLAKVIKHVKNIRNAAAHNQAILMDIAENRADRATKVISDYVLEISSISSTMRNHKLKNRKIHDLVAVLYIYENYIISEGIKKNRYQDLLELMERIKRNKDFYQQNPGLVSAYTFFSKIVDQLN
ncbi:Abi-like protein [Planococcus sp. MB-3u-09]|uniref:Abi family protein n=2 Tax=Planococcus TaxID=1372 RepID=UPI000C7CE6DD|nr:MULTISPECIES: Abi family protein [unclassified Planococcus (in: firmicutes)]PKG46517.1 Abi-like protein [Planococcus sp. Urea-trap-24]PKG89797.1 Abi-like protein [Planococcus sp. Urea-3u-39]PKH40800.1 Abi-like protein [Planococcus sp. MB-3u-09]